MDLNDMRKPLEPCPAISRCGLRTAIACALLLVTACSQNYTVAVNDQPIFDPTGRLFNGQLADADLQGCVNIAMQQQNVQNAGLLRVLSCTNSEVRSLANIEQLAQLRFMDLSNNNIRELSPLQRLRSLGGLNLMNNAITDISPLLNMPNLANVNLVGNNGIPCEQIQALGARLRNNLTRPERCRS